MQFLKMLLLALTVGFAVAFAINNWTIVSLQLWGGLIADVNLPLLLLTAFLLGLIPMWIAYGATRWRLRQRLATCERTIADLRVATAPAAPVAAPATFAVPEVAATPPAAPAHDLTPPAAVEAAARTDADEGETRL